MSLGINNKIFWYNRGIHPREVIDWKRQSVIIDQGHYEPPVQFRQVNVNAGL